MVVAPEILDIIEALEAEPFEGSVFRHMFAGKDPSLENWNGARWNPPDLPAIYTSLERSTALAEADYRLSLEPLAPRPSLKRTLHEIQVVVEKALDLRDETLLQQIGLGGKEIENSDFRPCQEVGFAVAFLGHGGMLVPSARASGGGNLVIYPRSLNPGHFEVLQEEDITGRIPPGVSWS